VTAGTYGGGTFGSLWGVGGGLYIDNHGRIYPQAYGGTPGIGLSAGYTPDLEGLLTGTSISGSPGKGPVRFNAGTSASAAGFGIGTPGIGVTHGFGPLEMSPDFSQPWSKPYIRDSAATAGVPSRNNVWEYDYPESMPIPSGPGASTGVAKTPQQIANFLSRYVFPPSMGPTGEASLFARSPHDSSGTIGANASSAIPFLSSREQNPLGNGMSGWNASAHGRPASSAPTENGLYGSANGANVNPRASVFAAGAPPVPFLSAPQSASGGPLGSMARAGAIDPFNPDQPMPGGLLGLIYENMRNNYSSGR